MNTLHRKFALHGLVSGGVVPGPPTNNLSCSRPALAVVRFLLHPLRHFVLVVDSFAVRSDDPTGCLALISHYQMWLFH